MKISLLKLIFSLLLFGGGFVVFCSVPAFAGTPVATQSALVASPATIPPDGTTASTITVTLKDASGAPVVGDNVELLVPTDTTVVINPGSVFLNASGQGTFTLTSTQTGTDSINVLDATSATPLNGLGQVQIGVASNSQPASNTSGTGGSSCNNQYPPSAPNLYAVFKNRNHTSATLYFVPPPLPYDGFTVSYGLSASADTYAISFSQGQSTGAIKYTVNSLIKDGAYYFKARANNGCAGGPWSNVKSMSSAVSSLPKTGPNDFFINMGLIGIISVLAGAVILVAF